MKKFFSLLVLLAAVVTGAVAQEEILLTTLTFGGSETYGETTSGVVSVTATNVSLYNGTFGWLLAEESSLSVTAKEGYTITKCVFRQNAKTPITDTEAPFEIHTNDWGGIIEDPYEEMNGVTSIEVYGYANAGGGSATTVVTITDSDFPAWGDSFTKDGVTVSAEMLDGMYGNISGPGSFSTTLGNFTKIEIFAEDVFNLGGEGWSIDFGKATWTGNASSVSFTGDINGNEEGVTLKFTIEPASTPEPAGEVTVVFAANNNTVERTVTLPHDFSCSYSNKDGELDAIIKELYEISAGHCSDDNYPVASGNEAVLAGSKGFDNYITISAAFEGTATVSGWYWNSDAYDGDGDWMDYSLTISIKGDEPEPQGETITVTWNGYDLPSSGSTFTKDGVTLTCDIDDDLYGPGTFTTDLGNFTQIVVSGDEACYINATGGWSGNINQKTWTGNAAIVPFDGDIYTFSSDVTFVFTIEPASTPEPAGEVTVVFAANDKTAERTVTLPHTFKCDWAAGMDEPDELDIIIHELYNDYYYCNSNMNASGSDQVEAGTEEDPKNDYITIKGVFEGTATVTGDYLDYIAGDYGEHNYSITISIKGTPTAVENVQTNHVQATKFFRDGMLLIEKNGKIYNATGAEVK
jgi:hypothetical protein